MTTINPGVTSNVASATNNNGASSNKAEAEGGIASNFQTFLTLLTTQLKNQNPLDPLDTNQFTAQLVQFAQVEQQLKANDQLKTLVALQQTAQATQALDYVGQRVVVDGDTAPLTDGNAVWWVTVDKPVTATITITAANGQTVMTSTRALDAGKNQALAWDGKDASDKQWPDGNYKITITAKDANGQAVSIPTEIQAVVDSADLTESPPLLSIAGKDYTIDKLKRVIRN
ncbi:MAG: flagellar biosynthesis protein FlgD [Xanthobacteraceae bacterium]|nr:flagellar biosynthesis protein FlgD [Xanthobacteraceae bacterium]